MMSRTIQLTRADAARALCAYHMRWGTLPEVFARLRSVQYDPLCPCGSNHDLVLQARVKNYRIGDWQNLAYQKRQIYDGWDKQACLIPFSGWNARRIFGDWHSYRLRKINEAHPGAVDAVLKELNANGPMSPRDFEFQQHRPEWKGSWYGPSLTKQTLRALWDTGQIMTHSRKNGQHVYDMTERVVPSEHLHAARMSDEEAIRWILRDRHAAMGLIRPIAPFEVWSINPTLVKYRPIRDAMVAEGELIPVDIEGIKANASPDFLPFLEEKPPSRATFIAPLDQLIWDRKMIAQVFGFAYKWEVYVPEHLREYGYYVLPVVYGDRFIGRAEFVQKKAVLEMKRWIPEKGRVPGEAVAKALKRFMGYCGATELVYGEGVPEFLSSTEL